MADQDMRVIIGQYHTATDDYLTFAKQLGVSGVQFNIQRPTADLSDALGYWTLDELKRLKQRVNDFDLELEAIENVPKHFYIKAMLGQPGRDEQIANYQTIIRNMGEAGIPILGYNWMPNSVWRTPMQIGRGGVKVTAFDMALAAAGQVTNGLVEVPEAGGKTYTEDEMWDNYVYFMEAAVPVAEEAGVKLALHPDDPPVPELGGIARLFYHPDGFKRALEAVPSPNSGLDFCMGCFSEMTYGDQASGEGVLDALRYFGERGKLFYIHFRDVQGCVPVFQECFLGEGNVDVIEAIRTLHEVGFDGFIIDDHVPEMIDDSNWRHRGHAYSTGYIMALVDTVKRLA
jgi:mannonate dehydratase